MWPTAVRGVVKSCDSSQHWLAIALTLFPLLLSGIRGNLVVLPASPLSFLWVLARVKVTGEVSSNISIQILNL